MTSTVVFRGINFELSKQYMHTHKNKAMRLAFTSDDFVYIPKLAMERT